MKYAATQEHTIAHAQNVLGLDIKGHWWKKLLVAEASRTCQGAASLVLVRSPPPGYHEHPGDVLDRGGHGGRRGQNDASQSGLRQVHVDAVKKASTRRTPA